MFNLSRIGFDVIYCSVCLGMIATTETEPVMMSPLFLFLFSTLISVVAGTAALYRTNRGKDIKRQDLIEHALNMGTCGAALSMILYSTLEPHAMLDWKIIGIVGMLTLGGMPTITFLTERIKAAAERLLPTGSAQEEKSDDG